MKESRQCIICPETFSTKSTSNRKTCSTQCSRKYHAAYYLKNKDKIAASKAAYYLKNKDKLAASQAAYRLKNKDKLAAYYLKNKDKIAASKAAYYLKNKDKLAASKAAYYLKNKEFSKKYRADSLPNERFSAFKKRMEVIE